MQVDRTGCRTGNGDKLSSSQAEPGQAIKSDLAYFPSISCATSCRVALYYYTPHHQLNGGSGAPLLPEVVMYVDRNPKIPGSTAQGIVTRHGPASFISRSRSTKSRRKHVTHPFPLCTEGPGLHRRQYVGPVARWRHRPSVRPQSERDFPLEREGNGNAPTDALYRPP